MVKAFPRDEKQDLLIMLAEVAQRADDRRGLWLVVRLGIRVSRLGAHPGDEPVASPSGPQFIQDEQAGDPQQPGQLVAGPLVEPSPRHDERLGGDILGRRAIRQPPARVGEDSRVVLAEAGVEPSTALRHRGWRRFARVLVRP